MKIELATRFAPNQTLIVYRNLYSAGIRPAGKGGRENDAKRARTRSGPAYRQRRTGAKDRGAKPRPTAFRPGSSGYRSTQASARCAFWISVRSPPQAAAPEAAE